MVRTREFDSGQALDTAMRVFWDQGYADTSMDDLVKATGVSRYGIYGTFGNKRELFIKALRHYAHGMLGSALADLSRPDASMTEIRAFFEQRMAASEEAGTHMGCMVCNTATEVAPHDEEIAAAVRELFNELAGFLANALENARQAGEVSADLDPRATSFYLVGLLQGLAVMGRAGYSVKDAHGVVSTALATLQ